MDTGQEKQPRRHNGHDEKIGKPKFNLTPALCPSCRRVSLSLSASISVHLRLNLNRRYHDCYFRPRFGHLFQFVGQRRFEFG